MVEPKIESWNTKYVKGGKRVNVRESGTLPDWFVGYGKDRSCQIEGPWHHWVTLAMMILSADNTRQLEDALGRDDLYHPEMEAVALDIEQYTGTPYEFEE